MELKKALQTALDFEEKGHKIYKEAAAKSENPIVKKTFGYLAEQEMEHIEKIKGYIEEKHPEVDPETHTLDDAKKFFGTTVQEFKDKTEVTDSDLKAHETALELEKESYEFYKQQKEETSDNAAKNFFDFLMRQEDVHFELIQKAYQFLKDPVGFFAEAEGWIFEGG